MKGNAQFFDDCVFLSITLQWLKDILNPDFFQPQSLTRDFSTSIFNPGVFKPKLFNHLTEIIVNFGF